MKRLISALLTALFLITLCGCSTESSAQVAATTLPVYEFTARLCEGTGITVTRLVTEEVSCLHDYSLNVRQVRAAEAAEVIVISGAGMEDFMSDLLAGKSCIDSSAGIELLCGEEAGCDHGHDHHDGHSHDQDPHIWLSPENAIQMAANICQGLCLRYPQHAALFQSNLEALTADLSALQTYGEETLSSLSCREIITFHDGFAYFAQSFDLTILESIEEESGSEASAQELRELIDLIAEHDLPAIFVETYGSVSASEVITRETGAASFPLDMAMGGNSYFDAMYHNINTIKEALG